MSTTLGPMEASLSSLTLAKLKSSAWNFKPVVLQSGSDELLQYPRASFLGLPLEIRDMIYEFLARSYKIATTPVLLTSNKPGYKHLVVAGGHAKVCRDTLLLRYYHAYNNLLLINCQVNKEIAAAAKLYLPFSFCDGMADHLNNAKTIILSWVDAVQVPHLAPNEIYFAHSEGTSAYWERVWFYRGLTAFFDWCKQRIHEVNPPRLITKVEGFLRASVRRADPHSKDALVSLDIHMSSESTGFVPIPMDYMQKIGYILSDEIVSSLRSHRLQYSVDHPVPLTAIGELRALLPWGHLGHLDMDEDSVRYSPEVSFKQITQC